MQRRPEEPRAEGSMLPTVTFSVPRRVASTEPVHCLARNPVGLGLAGALTKARRPSGVRQEYL